MKKQFLEELEKKQIRSIAKNLGVNKVEKKSKTKLINVLMTGFTYSELLETFNTL